MASPPSSAVPELHGVHAVSIDEQVEQDGRPFPLVLAPQEEGKFDTPAAFVAWANDHRAEIEELVRVHGAVLFRGFPVDAPEDFAKFIEDGLGVTNYPYIGGAAVRINVVGDRVVTSNASPPEAVIPFHHELSQVPKPPLTLFFYCDVEPPAGGETPILVSHRVFERLESSHPEFAGKLESLGVRYIRVMPEEDDAESPIGRSWKSTFQCDTREGAEKKMTEAGTTWRWNDDGSLWTQTATVPAVRVNPRTGKKAFFNSAVAAYTGWTDSRNDGKKAVCFGDGTPVDAEAMEVAVKYMDEETVAFRWKHKDALFIDNRAVMHARRPFTPPRRILASIGSSTVGGSTA